MTKYIVGNIYSTPKGDFKTLEYIKGYRTPEGKPVRARLVIRMLKTGTVLNVQTSNVDNGKFRDNREPSVYGIGYLGSDIKIPQRGSSQIRRAYDLWANMLKRVVHEYTGISVDPRWLSFTSFLNTLPDVRGYSAWEAGEDVHLDKDFSRNKCYSVTDCEFVSASDNVRESALRRWHGK